MAWTELHDLCASPDSTPQHFLRLQLHTASHSHEASEESDDGSLPLHYLLRNNPPLEIVQDLVEAYPEAVFMAETTKGYYPLHVACRYGCSTKVVEYLIEQNPQILQRKSRRFLLCCIEECMRLCRGRGLDGWTCEEMTNALPDHHPNRQPLLELLHKHEDKRTKAGLRKIVNALTIHL